MSLCTGLQTHLLIDSINFEKENFHQETIISKVLLESKREPTPVKEPNQQRLKRTPSSILYSNPTSLANWEADFPEISNTCSGHHTAS